MVWQVHVYGEAGSDLSAWCRERDIPLHIFAWRADFETVGLARDALYLIRPDGYVAFAEASGGAEVLDRFWRDAKIALASGGSRDYSSAVIGE